MRTDAPNACGGRLDLNFDLTTPELPCGRDIRLCSTSAQYFAYVLQCLIYAPPDYADLGTINLTLCTVDVCDTLGMKKPLELNV